MALDNAKPDGLGGKRKGGKKGGDRNATFAKVVDLDVKDGVGTLTVMARKSRDEEPKEVQEKYARPFKVIGGAHLFADHSSC